MLVVVINDNFYLLLQISLSAKQNIAPVDLLMSRYNAIVLTFTRHHTVTHYSDYRDHLKLTIIQMILHLEIIFPLYIISKLKMKYIFFLKFYLKIVI